MDRGTICWLVISENCVLFDVGLEENSKAVVTDLIQLLKEVERQSVNRSACVKLFQCDNLPMEKG